MKNTDEKKITETITFRTTAELKLKMTQRASDEGLPLSPFIEKTLCDLLESTENGIPLHLKDHDSLAKLYKIIETVLNRNLSLQERVDSLEKQVKTPVNKLAIEKTEPKEKKQETILEKIIDNIPVEEKDEFILRYNTMIECRVKKRLDNSESEIIYKCVNRAMKSVSFITR